MYNVAFFADTHYRDDGEATYWTPRANLAVEAILFGGDNHYRPDHLAKMLAAIRETQTPETALVVIPGNGDYLEQELGESRAQSRAAVENISNAYFLDDETLELPNGLRIIGSTLWSYVDGQFERPYQQRLAEFGLKGVDDIRVGDRYLTLADTNAFHLRARAFIETTLRALSRSERRRTIVCSHFWPTLEWIDPTADDDVTFWKHMIGTSLDDLIREVGPRYWLCGHLHETKQVAIGETHVLSNPRAGSALGKTNPNFRDDLVISFSRD